MVDDLIQLARAAAQFTYGARVRLSFEEQSSSYPAEKRWRLVVRDRGEVVADTYAPSLAESARRFARGCASRSREAIRAHRDIDHAATCLGL